MDEPAGPERASDTDEDMIWLEDDVLKGPLDFEVNVYEKADHSTTSVAKRKSKVIGGWKRINMTPAFSETLIPCRPGVRIQRHHGAANLEQWQVWYPKLDPTNPTEAASRNATTPGAFKKVQHWVWTKHATWLTSK